MSLKNIRNTIKNKEIIIFGTGVIAQNFFSEFGRELNIHSYTSNDLYETEFDDLNRINLSELNGKKDIYFVVCAGQDGTANIFNQLSMNYKFYDDYIDSESFVQLIEQDKKVLIIEGLCHQELIAEGLKYIKEINNNYIIKFFWTANVKKNLPLKKMLSQYSEYAEAIVRLRMKGVRQQYMCGSIINIPLVYFAPVYPQISWNQEMGSTYLENPYMLKSSQRLGDIRAFRYTDKNIVALLKKGLNEDDIIWTLADEDFYSKKQIDDNLLLAKKVLNANDAICDVKLGNYVMNHFRCERLFLDGQHWSNEMAVECIRQILRIMKIEEKWIREPNMIQSLALKNAVWESEVPIYPSVRKKLDIQWADENTMYKMVRLKKTESLSFEEYMRTSIKYIYHSLKLQEVW